MATRAPLLSLAILAVAIACGGSDAPDDVEFAIAVDRLPAAMRDELAAELDRTDTVRLRLPGQVFNPPRPARIIPRDSIDRTSLLAAADADFSAFKAEDDAWIVETFAVGERAEIAGFLADSTIRAGSRDMFRRMDRQDIYAVAEFETDSARYGYVFLRYLPGERRFVVNSYALEDGEWRRTNTILRERTTRFVNVAFRSGTIQPVR